MKKANWYVRLFRWIKGHSFCRHFSMGSVYCYDCLIMGCKQYKVCYWNYSEGAK
jgi:hypothetical protein